MPASWAAVGNAITKRLAELAMKQNELAARSGVSVATIREIQRGIIERRRHPRVLREISVSLDWPANHLKDVLQGRQPDEQPHEAEALTGKLVTLPAEEEPRAETAVRLLNLLDIERGAALRAEATVAAVRVACELSDGITQAERIAVYEFLTEVAKAVRWP